MHSELRGQGQGVHAALRGHGQADRPGHTRPRPCLKRVGGDVSQSAVPLRGRNPPPPFSSLSNSLSRRYVNGGARRGAPTTPSGRHFLRAARFRPGAVGPGKRFPHTLRVFGPERRRLAPRTRAGGMRAVRPRGRNGLGACGDDPEARARALLCARVRGRRRPTAAAWAQGARLRTPGGCTSSASTASRSTATSAARSARSARRRRRRRRRPACSDEGGRAKAGSEPGGRRLLTSGPDRVPTVIWAGVGSR